MNRKYYNYHVESWRRCGRQAGDKHTAGCRPSLAATKDRLPARQAELLST